MSAPLPDWLQSAIDGGNIDTWNAARDRALAIEDRGEAVEIGFSLLAYESTIINKRKAAGARCRILAAKLGEKHESLSLGRAAAQRTNALYPDLKP